MRAVPLSYIYFQQDQYAHALACAEQQLTIAQANGDKIRTSIALYNTGTSYFHQAQDEQARTFLQHALDYC